MTTQESFINGLRGVAKWLKPLIVSPAVAPFLVVFIGLVLHGSFTVTSKNQVIFGGPGDEGGEVIATAQAAELVATNQIIGFVDELEGEIGPVLYSDDSLSASTMSPFGVTDSTPIDGVEVHRIKPGETLYSVAEVYGITQKALTSANRGVSEPLIVGDALIIPGASTPTTPGAKVDVRRIAGAYLPAGFRWPAAGKIGPAHGRFDGRDIPNLLGTSIMAAGPGTVIAADYGWVGGYGNRVIIDHGDGLQTLYGHLNDLVVTIGQVVNEGEVIGFMGSTGRSTGPHVHFEVRWNQ